MSAVGDIDRIDDIVVMIRKKNSLHVVSFERIADEKNALRLFIMLIFLEMYYAYGGVR